MGNKQYSFGRDNYVREQMARDKENRDREHSYNMRAREDEFAREHRRTGSPLRSKSGGKNVSFAQN